MSDPYETEELLNQYLLFHYGQDEEILPRPVHDRAALRFPTRCVRETFDLTRLDATSRALDVGCSVGRSSFELARRCGEVIGIDLSQSFINAANQLKQSGALQFSHKLQGAIRLRAEALVPSHIDRSRTPFETGDACNLRDHLGTFDALLAANLICRIPQPHAFLARLPGLLKPGGQLVITSPYTWDVSYTPREHWLGGTESTGESTQALEHQLAPDFTLLETRDMPFIIREHARKYQWSIAQATIWRRK